MIKRNNMPPEERFSRTLFGVILVLSAFISWGRWLALILGGLFLASAWLGYCATCEMYRKFSQSK